MKYLKFGQPSVVKALVITLAICLFEALGLDLGCHLWLVSKVSAFAGNFVGHTLVDLVFSPFSAVIATILLVVVWVSYFFARQYSRDAIYEGEQPADGQKEASKLKPKTGIVFWLIAALILGFVFGPPSNNKVSEAPEKSASKLSLAEKYHSGPLDAGPEAGENLKREARISLVPLPEFGSDKVGPPAPKQSVELRLVSAGLLAEQDVQEKGWPKSVREDVLTVHGGFLKTWNWVWVVPLSIVLVFLVLVFVSTVKDEGDVGDRAAFCFAMFLFIVLVGVTLFALLDSGCRRDFVWKEIQSVDVDRLAPADMQALVSMRKAAPSAAVFENLLVDSDDVQGKVFAYVIWIWDGNRTYSVIKRVLG